MVSLTVKATYFNGILRERVEEKIASLGALNVFEPWMAKQGPKDGFMPPFQAAKEVIYEGSGNIVVMWLVT